MNINRRARIGLAIATAAAAAGTGALTLAQSGGASTSLASSCLSVAGKSVCVVDGGGQLGAYEFTPHAGDATGALLVCSGKGNLNAIVLAGGKGPNVHLASINSCPF
jgi:hypothetical protein